MKKYELIKDGSEPIKTIDGKRLYRIRALRDIPCNQGITINEHSFNRCVKAGDLGGYVESEYNLSHNNNCWIFDNACVYDNAVVLGNATIDCEAEVSGDAKVYDRAYVSNFSIVTAKAEIYGNAHILNTSCIDANAKIHGTTFIRNKSAIFDNVEIFGKRVDIIDAMIFGNAKINGCVLINAVYPTEWSLMIYGNAEISGNVTIKGNVRIYGKTIIQDASIISDNPIESGLIEIGGYAKVYNNAEIIYSSQDIGHTIIHGDAEINKCLKLTGDNDINKWKYIMGVY